MVETASPLLHVILCMSLATCFFQITCDAIDPEPKIINGKEVDPKFSFPFMASLALNGKHSCGGTLIAPDIILTAAHCFRSIGEAQLKRHNIRNTTETYESYVVEKIITHPLYYSNRFADPDAYDVSIIKLFGHSPSIRPIPLMPENPTSIEADTPLLTMGWGKANVAGPSGANSELLQTTLHYVPNEECFKITGVFNTVDIDYSQRIIDVSLCAKDAINGSDTCQGDSGGPLLLPTTPQDTLSTVSLDPQKLATEQLIQVGITSYGFGCAHPTFPGVYARVSHVREWIDEQVCSESEHPTDGFGCDRPKTGIILEDANDDVDSNPKANTEMVTLRLRFRLDLAPQERGWIIRTLNDHRGEHQPEWTTIKYSPIFSYDISESFLFKTEYITVPNNCNYVLTVLDSYGDGHVDALGELDLTLHDNGTNTSLLSDQDLAFASAPFRYFNHIPFTVGVAPSAAPTTTSMPTSAPTDLGDYISVQMQFDGHQDEIGFRLEQRTDPNGEFETLHAVYPGTYDLFVLAYKTETLALHLPTFIVEDRSDPNPDVPMVQYKFTMTSNERKGFGDDGKYAVWLGDAGLGELLFEGGDFSLEEVNEFELPAKIGYTPTMAPTTGPTSAPTPSSGLDDRFSLMLVAWCVTMMSVIIPFSSAGL